MRKYGTTVEQGLSSEEVLKRQREVGKNVLDEEPPVPLWKLVLEQFDDYLVQILLGSAVFSFFVALFEDSGEKGFTAFVEPFVILLILILNGIVGVWQETNAASALSALKKMQSEKAQCVRDGTLEPNILAEELVPGDVIRVFLVSALFL